jgi:putative ABC transport system ATP-binding protein
VAASGKSTLLNLIAGPDRPTRGSVIVAGERVDQLSETGTARFRRREIGMIFQFFNLLEDLTIEDNLLLPAQLTGMRITRARERAAELLAQLGIERYRDTHLGRLSGGERQRVAIARALVNSPALLLADEPTGAVDTATGEEIGRLLLELNQQGQTLVLVTHSAGQRTSTPGGRCSWSTAGSAATRPPLRPRPATWPAAMGDGVNVRAVLKAAKGGAARGWVQTAVMFVVVGVAAASGGGVDARDQRERLVREGADETSRAGRGGHGRRLEGHRCRARAHPPAEGRDAAFPRSAHAGGRREPIRSSCRRSPMFSSCRAGASGRSGSAEITALQKAGAPRLAQMLYTFRRASSNGQTEADIAELKAALPVGAIISSTSLPNTQRFATAGSSQKPPYVEAYAVIVLLLASLITAIVVAAAVLASYRRIGVLKSIGFTPAQIATSYLAQLTIPALVGAAVGTAVGSDWARALTNGWDANAGVPLWIKMTVPVAVCALVALAGLIPALHAARLTAVQALAAGQSPRTAGGARLSRLVVGLPMPRPVALGVASTFSKPGAALATAAVVAAGLAAAVLAVGLNAQMVGLVVGATTPHNGAVLGGQALVRAATEADE